MIKRTIVAMSLTVVVAAAAIPQTALAGSGSNAFVGSLLGGALGSAISNSYYNNQRKQQQAQQRKTYKKKTYRKKKRRTKPAAPAISTEGVKVQKALRSAGYYNGPFNGKLASYDTRAAIMQYQLRYGLNQTGVLSPDVKGVLLQQGDNAELSTHLSNAGYSQREKAKRLQAALKVQGFYTATIDGDFGPKSQAAMRLYQQTNGMTPSGALFPEQELDLVAASVQMLQQQRSQSDMVLAQVAARYRSLQQGAYGQAIPVQQPPAPMQQAVPVQQQTTPVRHQPASIPLMAQQVMSPKPSHITGYASEAEIAPLPTPNTGISILTVMTELKVQDDVFAETLAELPAGKQVSVNSIQGEWAHVSVDGQQGYIYADFLDR